MDDGDAQCLPGYLIVDLEQSVQFCELAACDHEYGGEQYGDPVVVP